MQIFKHECRKALTSPVLLGLLAVFISFNLFVIISSWDHKEQLQAVNGIIDQYGRDITDDSLDQFEQDLQADLLKLSDTTGQNIENIHDFLDSLPLEKQQTYLADPFVSQLLVKSMYLGMAQTIDEDYAAIDMDTIAAIDMAKYGLTGQAEELYRKEAEKFKVRFTEMVDAGEHKQWFFAGKMYAMHSFLYKTVFLHLTIEVLLLVVLATGLITSFEFEQKTHLVTYSTTRGRKLKKNKLLASLAVSSVVFAILYGITLGMYFAVFDYSHVWNTSVNSAFNWEYNFPNVSWWDLSMGQFLMGALSLVFIALLLFSGLTFAVATFVKNSYITFFVMAAFFILMWLLPSFMPKSSILLFAAAYTLSTLLLAIPASFMGSSGLLLFKNFEWLTISCWTIIMMTAVLLSYKRFMKEDL